LAGESLGGSAAAAHIAECNLADGRHRSEDDVAIGNLARRFNANSSPRNHNAQPSTRKHRHNPQTVLGQATPPDGAFTAVSAHFDYACGPRIVGSGSPEGASPGGKRVHLWRRWDGPCHGSCSCEAEAPECTPCAGRVGVPGLPSGLRPHTTTISAARATRRSEEWIVQCAVLSSC